MLSQQGKSLVDKSADLASEKITYFGEKLMDQRIQIDSSSTQSITNMPSLTDKEGVQQFLGTVTFVGKPGPKFSGKMQQPKSFIAQK